MHILSLVVWIRSGKGGRVLSRFEWLLMKTELLFVFGRIAYITTD